MLQGGRENRAVRQEHGIGDPGLKHVASRALVCRVGGVEDRFKGQEDAVLRRQTGQAGELQAEIAHAVVRAIEDVAADNRQLQLDRRPLCRAKGLSEPQVERVVGEAVAQIERLEPELGCGAEFGWVCAVVDLGVLGHCDRTKYRKQRPQCVGFRCSFHVRTFAGGRRLKANPEKVEDFGTAIRSLKSPAGAGWPTKPRSRQPDQMSGCPNAYWTALSKKSLTTVDMSNDDPA
jgi:hypothetical protein